MTINTDVFTPVASLTGGVMIGLAAMVLILCCGRIAGISGIIGGLLSRATQDKGWRLAFVVGMLAAPWLYRLVGTLPASEITTPLPLLVIAGLLVGVGTRYGSGCTSGHGVCGLSRGSLRSLVATLIFMLTAFATVWIVGALPPLA
ncbi:YeeE/YedE family protein [Musicola paradisiaca]|uniref:YeeE/YedE family protein n=1 Tax=Musicola paradisiaca (strain Ech703) TaxID=579405 RepID=C6C4U7_MUSP7|nr:YeeE/YedE family protein [Musicola paradisiaca]ACS87504.1 protein of unknown function DUF395 YeeE/YedE [Musicola paradisiaca Ech703]